MSSENLIKNLRILGRTDRIIADVRLRHLLIGMGMPALAALIAAFGLLMLELAGYFALVRMAPLPKHRSLRPLPRSSLSRPRLGREFRRTSLGSRRSTPIATTFCSSASSRKNAVTPCLWSRRYAVRHLLRAIFKCLCKA